MSEIKLKIFQKADNIRIFGNGICIIEGLAFDDLYKLSFTKQSGAQSDISFRGNITKTAFLLKGKGKITLGSLSLKDALIQISPEGVVVHSRIRWSNRFVPLLFLMSPAETKWTGYIEFSELVSCSIIQPEELEIKINTEISGPDFRTGKIIVHSVLKHHKIKFTEKLPELSVNSFPGLRKKLLERFIHRILQELDEAEFQHSSIDSNNGLPPPFSKPFEYDPDQNGRFRQPLGLDGEENLNDLFKKRGNSPYAGTNPNSGPGNEPVKGYLNENKYVNPFHLSFNIKDSLFTRSDISSKENFSHKTLTGYLPSERQSVLNNTGSDNQSVNEVQKFSSLRMPGSGYVNAGKSNSAPELSMRGPFFKNDDGMPGNNLPENGDQELQLYHLHKTAQKIIYCKDLLRSLELLMKNDGQD